MKVDRCRHQRWMSKPAEREDSHSYFRLDGLQVRCSLEIIARDDVWLANFQRMSGFHVERKLLWRPTKHNLPNLTPLRLRNFPSIFRHRVPPLATRCTVRVNTSS